MRGLEAKLRKRSEVNPDMPQRTGAEAAAAEQPEQAPAQPRPAAPIRDEATLTEHIQALRRYARALARNVSDADDLVQETLKRALVYLDDGREIRNLRAYLLSMLHNVRIDALKQSKRGGEQVAVDEGMLPANDASPGDRMTCQQVMQAIDTLSEDHRQVLLLVGLEGLSYRETAEVLGVPIGTVMSRLNRARAALRGALGAEDEDLFGFSD